MGFCRDEPFFFEPRARRSAPDLRRGRPIRRREKRNGARPPLLPLTVTAGRQRSRLTSQTPTLPTFASVPPPQRSTTSTTRPRQGVAPLSRSFSSTSSDASNSPAPACSASESSSPFSFYLNLNRAAVNLKLRRRLARAKRARRSPKRRRPDCRSNACATKPRRDAIAFLCSTSTRRSPPIPSSKVVSFCWTNPRDRGQHLTPRRRSDSNAALIRNMCVEYLRSQEKKIGGNSISAGRDEVTDSLEI